METNIPKEDEQVTTGAFTVIPDDTPEEDTEVTEVKQTKQKKSKKTASESVDTTQTTEEVKQEQPLDPHIMKWANAALEQGIAKADVDRALDYIKTNPGLKLVHQSDFYNIIEEILADDNKVQEQNQRILEATVSRDISNFGDINRALHNKIREVYNTSAVSSMALGDYLNRHLQQTDLDASNGNACYWAYYHIRSELVQSGISNIFQKWDKSKNVHTFIADYAEQSGNFTDCTDFKAICQKMAKLLPDVYAKEDSPLKYKAWKYVIIQMNGGRDLTNEDTALFNSIFNDVRTMTEYCANFQNAVESGEPVEHAEAMATGAATSVNTAIPLATKIGQLGGKVAALKYSWSDSFERGMIEGAGDHAQAMLEHQNEINMRREQLRMNREDAKMQAKAMRQRQDIYQSNGFDMGPDGQPIPMQAPPPEYQQPYQDQYQQPYQDPYQQPYVDPRARRPVRGQRQRMMQHLDQYGRPIPEYDDYGQPIHRSDPRYRSNRRNEMYGNQRQPRDYMGQYADDDYGAPAPPMNIKVVILVVHIFAAILMLLLVKPLGVIGTIGLGAAAFGWYKTHFEGNTPLLTNPETGENSMIIFAIGYVLAILALFIH